LNETGANVPVDGINGPATQAAIVVFQQAHGLPSTGSLDTGGIDVLKHSAAGSMIAGTWTGTIFQTGTLLGTLDAVWVSNVTAQLTFSYLPCTGTATYLDFDGVHLTVHTQLAPISTPSCNQSGTSVATFTSPTSLTFDSAATFGPTSGVMTRVG
jgi:peptidoglycan hydrolase-like protein with peptidoglycan-binding domain